MQTENIKMSNEQASGGAGSVDLADGVLEIQEDRKAYLRSMKRHLVPRTEDPEVPRDLIAKFGLRGGELLVGPQIAGGGGGGGGGNNRRRRGGRGGRGNQRQQNHNNAARSKRLRDVVEVNGIPIDEWQAPTPLQETIAIDPDNRIRFETSGGPAAMKIVELFTPIGFGQRALIVAPPRTGKTTLLQQMAHGISTNHPDVYMIVLLIDERPEEVTDMRRSINGEVIASSNDLDVESHVRVARLTIERARRLAEEGRHIVILLDSITRLGRAFNNYIKGSGRTMTGGLDIKALQEPKQVFGSARNIEGGGSLTIIATALVDTGSRADEFIFQEFKGTGNMELVLNRELADYRIWPALDLQQSGTRKEEKLLTEDELAKQHMLRRQLLNMPMNKQVPALLEKMDRHETLADFLATLRA